jgi:hypothetical protein
MQRISRLYVSHFGSPTAWYDHLLFDLTDPDSLQPTDVIFNLENAGGKTSLLSYVFSCFEPKQDRWLQHLQEKSHRFSEYFARDGRVSFIVMEWDTEYAPPPLYAWYFLTSGGTQHLSAKLYQYYAWAVSPGQVPAVPVPGAVWLMSSGLLGLLGLKRRGHAG